VYWFAIIGKLNISDSRFFADQDDEIAGFRGWAKKGQGSGLHC